MKKQKKVQKTQKKKIKYKIHAAHQLQAFIEQLLVKTALTKKTFKGILEIPYNEIMKKNIDMSDIKIKVTIIAHWDADLEGDFENVRNIEQSN